MLSQKIKIWRIGNKIKDIYLSAASPAPWCHSSPNPEFRQKNVFKRRLFFHLCYISHKDRGQLSDSHIGEKKHSDYHILQ